MTEVTELDTELRTNLCLMNDLFDNILSTAKIQQNNLPVVDLTTSQDFAAMGEMLMGKLSLIENCCDTAAASTQKKYDARTIRDKIAVKKKELAALESENTALVETAKRQEKALRKLNASSDDTVEAQQNVMKLKSQLQAAQKEIKLLEERRHDLLAENRRLKGQVNFQQKSLAGEATNVPQQTDEEIRAAMAQLKQKEDELLERKEREKKAYLKKMAALKQQKDTLAQQKADLEQRIKEKEMQLKLIHEKSKKTIGVRK